MRALASTLRGAAVRASRRLLRDELVRKRAIVALYNAGAAARRMTSRRSAEDLLDYRTLSLQHTAQCREYYRGNCLYGIAPELRRYAGYERPIKACIEHGVYFGDYVEPNEVVDSGLPAVITFSDTRRQLLHSVADKAVFAIGPYIRYVDGYWPPSRVAAARNELGKTLLVFPSHSIDRLVTHFDTTELIDRITGLACDGGFQTVLVCLFYRDLHMGRAAEYQQAGFRVVSAGYKFDPAFSGRLRTLIELADHTVGNSVGTHVGYSVALNTPHTLLSQALSWTPDSEADANKVHELAATLAVSQKREVARAFAEFSPGITPEQVDVCNRYWGLDTMLQPDELRAVMAWCDRVFAASGRREAAYRSAFLRERDAEGDSPASAILRKAVLDG